jgi:Uma2 family endonuclease
MKLDMATLTGLTIDDFEKLPQALAHYYELVDGELVDVSGNTPEHNILRDRLVELLQPAVRAAGLGLVISEQEYDFAGNAHGPDVTFIATAKLPLINKRLRVQRFVPDLAIEIVSSNDTFEKLHAKAKRYRACGVAEVWIFSIELRQAFRYSAAAGDAILDENATFAPSEIPGFSIRIGELLDRV